MSKWEMLKFWNVENLRFFLQKKEFYPFNDIINNNILLIICKIDGIKLGEHTLAIRFRQHHAHLFS